MMDYKYIEQLLERYFEAETTVVEEDILRAFFSQREVPEHLAHYAPLFAYAQEVNQEGLGLDFDRRLMERLEASGDAPTVHVKMRKMTISARLRPLWRSAAAVAIVALVGLSAREAWEQSPIAPVIGSGEAIVQPVKDSLYSPQRQIEESQQMAITPDSLAPADEAIAPDVPHTPR